MAQSNAVTGRKKSDGRREFVRQWKGKAMSEQRVTRRTVAGNWKTLATSVN
jgi:hypothetical protein